MQTMKRITFGTIGAALALVFFVTSALAVDIQTVTSKSGIKALLVEDYSVPLIALSFAFEGGSTQDLPGKEGTSKLLTGMLDEGAGDIDSKAFQAKLDELGLDLSFSTGSDGFSGRMKMLANVREEAFSLLSLALTKPRFDDEPISRMRDAFLTGLRQDVKSPNALVGRAWRESVFAGHPYARPTDGTLETMPKLTRADLQSYVDRVFAQDNLVIGVVGAISKEELAGLLDQTFGDLPKQSKLIPVPEAQPKIGEIKTIELNVPQAVIQMALPGLKRDNPDFYATYLVNQILGGGAFSSRLYREVREKRGLAYSVYSFLATYDHAGVFGAGTATRADRANESIDIIKAELKRMADEGPSEEELKKAKLYVKGSYAISNLDTSSKIAGVLVAIQRADLGIDYIDKRAEYIDAVTIEDARRVAKKYLSTPPTVIMAAPGKS